MPTPEANASSSVALRNANITELAVEEADSFKANVSIMTQDQCLDNGHQANSNNRSSSDKVSDDLNNSKNSVVSNGVNSVQEFNVDVNREYSTDLVIVQNSTLDADSPPTGKVLPTSKQLTETSSDFVYSKDNSLNNNIDANKSECANNIVADMTVITHQNSSENIRDIIANSEKANKNSNDSQLDKVGRSAKSDINSRNANNSAEPRRSRKLIRSANVNECEDDQIENPIERLNKLRASISSALSEVKGVLKQYSTEQSGDDQNESAPSKQPPDDGPVRFRFVRKIRRRSVFSEDDETEIPKTSTDLTASPIIENKVIEDIPNEFQDIQKTLSNENQDLRDQNEDKIFKNNSDEIDKKIIQTVTTESIADIQVPQDKSDNVYTTENKIEKTTKEESSIISAVEVSPSEVSVTPKIKNGKTKKVLKKNRRASIAAVEINQISDDQPQIPLELKTQRRPSDSGTLVKQTTRSKVSKTSEKPKLISKSKSRTSKTESSTIKPNQEILNDSEKNIATSSPTAAQENSSSPIADNTKILDIKSPDTISPLQSTQKTTSPAIEKMGIPEKTNSSPISTVIMEANTSAETTVAELKTPEVVPAPAVNSTVNADVPKTSPKVAEINTPAGTTVDKLNKAEVIPAAEVSTKVKNDLPQTVTPVKPNISQTPIHSPQSLKTSTEATKVGILNQQITNSKQLSQDSKTVIPISKTPNTSAVSSTKIPDASPITAKVELPKSIIGENKVLETKTKMSTEPEKTEVSKAATAKAEKIVANKKPNESVNSSNFAEQTSSSEISKTAAETSTQIDKKTSDTNATQADEPSTVEPDVPIPSNVPKDAVAVKLNLPGQESVEELQRLEDQQEKETSPTQTPEATTAAAPPKKKRKAKRKVVIRRIKRKLSKDDTFLLPQETASQLEIEEKEIEEKDIDEEPEEEVPKQPKSCLKNRQFEIGDVVMYAEHYKKTQVRWKKAIVTERITSISYKLNIEGEERPAHISYIKKFTDRKVNFGGKEYLEIDYAQIEENEEKERNYSIWNLV